MLVKTAPGIIHICKLIEFAGTIAGRDARLHFLSKAYF